MGTGGASTGVRLALVGAVRIHRDGLRNLLGQEDRLQVVSAVANPQEINGSTDRPELIVLDATPPDCFEMAGALIRIVPDVNVVVIGLEDSDQLAEQCSLAGICWYLGPQASIADLVSTILAISTGAMPCSARIAAALVRLVGRRTRDGHIGSGLTQRELEIFGCLTAGMTNKEIARHLGITLATAKNHVHNILAKLHAKNRTDAALQGPQQR